MMKLQVNKKPLSMNSSFKLSAKQLDSIADGISLKDFNEKETKIKYEITDVTSFV